MPEVTWLSSDHREGEGSRALPMAQLGITHRDAADGWCVVSLEGEVDLATAPRLEAALLELESAGGHQGFVIDLSGVSHFDSSGVRVMVRFVRRVGDGSVKLAAAGPNLQVVLKFAGLEDVLGVCPTVADALP